MANAYCYYILDIDKHEYVGVLSKATVHFHQKFFPPLTAENVLLAKAKCVKPETFPHLTVVCSRKWFELILMLSTLYTDQCFLAVAVVQDAATSLLRHRWLVVRGRRRGGTLSFLNVALALSYFNKLNSAHSFFSFSREHKSWTEMTHLISVLHKIEL